MANFNLVNYKPLIIMLEYYCSLTELIGAILLLIIISQCFFLLVLYIFARRLHPKIRFWRFFLMATSPFGFLVWIYLFIRDKGLGNNGIQLFLIEDTSY